MWVNMSVNKSKENVTYGINIYVPETLVENLISKGKKPSDIIAKIIKRLSIEMDINEFINFAESIKKPDNSTDNNSSSKNFKITRIWTYTKFEEYIRSLLLQERLASVGDVISMLVAYYNTSPRPTSEELRSARNFTGSKESWYEELRTAKARLTITAKHLGLPSFFLRAYGSGMNRRHPMNEEIYRYLCKWLSINKQIIKDYETTPTPRFAD